MLILIIGPMFAGKTNRLFELMSKYSYEKRGILFRKREDNRYGDENVVRSHSNFKFPAMVVKNIVELETHATDYDVVGIDEGQFYEGIVDVVDEMHMGGKIVIISMLNGDYRREPFDNVSRLYAKATKIHRMWSACAVCGKECMYTMLIDKSIVDDNKKLVISAGKTTFQPACELHWS